MEGDGVRKGVGEDEGSLVEINFDSAEMLHHLKSLFRPHHKLFDIAEHQSQHGSCHNHNQTAAEKQTEQPAAAPAQTEKK